jgi:hypothetical protein
MDETMSVTSLEVADILAGAGPPGLSDDEDDEDDVTTVCSDTETLDGEESEEEEGEGELPPLVDPPPAPSKHERLSNFVEQSMESFLTNLNGASSSSSRRKEPPDPRKTRFPVTSEHALEQRPVSVFTLIQNYSLSDVVLFKSGSSASSGLTLRDKMVSFQNIHSSSAEKSRSCILPCVSGIEVAKGTRVQGVFLKGDLIIEVRRKMR